MNIANVVLVLGKRLVNEQLTLEGRSRVEALSQALSQYNLEQTAVIFCGGSTDGQTQTEAQAMLDYFHAYHRDPLPLHLLLEDKSTNTIENISNAADALLASKLCRYGQRVNVVFVSNDYHLKRIFEIQSLMDEQGLLRTLKSRCRQSGLKLDIASSLDQHLAVPYPHHTKRGQIFLLLDELTTYRVYLEGTKQAVFARPLAQVRQTPLEIARHALAQLFTLIDDNEDVAALEEIQQAVEATETTICGEQLVQQLAQLNRQLTRLNRLYDPERAAS